MERGEAMIVTTVQDILLSSYRGNGELFRRYLSDD